MVTKTESWKSILRFQVSVVAPRYYHKSTHMFKPWGLLSFNGYTEEAARLQWAIVHSVVTRRHTSHWNEVCGP